MHIGIEYFNLAVGLNVGSGDLAGSFGVDVHDFGAVGQNLCGQSLKVKNDFGNVLFNPGNGGKLVNNAVQLQICGGDTGQAGKEYPSQAVAERGAVASLKRFNNEAAVRAVF